MAPLCFKNKNILMKKSELVQKIKYLEEENETLKLQLRTEQKLSNDRLNSYEKIKSQLLGINERLEQYFMKIILIILKQDFNDTRRKN